MGARFICHGADIIMVKQGLEAIQANFKPLGFSFNNHLEAMSAEMKKYK
jgi:4-hydroxy-2-oxoheptanedioate aldolase